MNCKTHLACSRSKIAEVWANSMNANFIENESIFLVLSFIKQLTARTCIVKNGWKAIGLININIMNHYKEITDDNWLDFIINVTQTNFQPNKTPYNSKLNKKGENKAKRQNQLMRNGYNIIRYIWITLKTTWERKKTQNLCVFF